MSILVKWATRSRFALFRDRFPLWANGRVQILIAMDDDDPELERYQNFIAFQAEHSPNIRTIVSPRSGKHGAMNAGLVEAAWDICILAQDDAIPTDPGYDLIVAAEFLIHAPDGDAVLYSRDGRRDDELNTMPILGRKYFDRFGYIYNPQYKGVWADNEFTDVARALGREIRYPQVIIRHRWIGQTSPDALLAHNESFFELDRQTYLRRKAAGFPKEAV